MLQLRERIAGYVQLDDSTSFYQPPLTTSDGEAETLQNRQQEPDVIVFCAWMGAQPKHIAKYTAGYQKLFPNTAILLIEAKYYHGPQPQIPHAAANNPFHPRLTDMLVGNDLTAAAQALHPYILRKRPRAYRATASIAMHASSNGGARNAAALATLLKTQGYAAPFDAVTLDCSPGKGELHSAARAVRLSLPPNPLLRAVSAPFIYLLLALYILSVTLLRRTDVIAWLRRTLNDRAMLGVNVPRLYLYSRADALVEARHVREHAADARAKGCGGVEVVEEEFTGAAHCALLNEDAGRYWGAVERVVMAEGRGRWAELHRASCT